MMLQQNVSRISDAMKAAATAALCVMVAVPQGMLAEASGSTPVANKTVRHETALTGSQKTLHALNRLTFGPRPGDEQAVSAMGLEAWFQQQLHPESIDDSKLEARLAAYPGLKLTPNEMMTVFPTPLFMRGQAYRHVPIPSDPMEHAVYTDWMAKYFDDMKKGDGELMSAAEAHKLATADLPGFGKGAKAAETSMDMGGGMGGDSMSGSPEKKGAADSHIQSPEEMAARAAKRGYIAPMNEDAVNAVVALAPPQRMARLVAMTPEEMVAFRKGLKFEKSQEVLAGLRPEQQEAVKAMMNGPLGTIEEETREARMLRDIYSERQLQAVMDDFWLNHFSVYSKKSEKEPYFLASYESEAILPNALGKFEPMLVATAKSPAMLMYLDNWESIGPNSPKVRHDHGKGAAQGINENYARELLELHTYGVRCEVSAEHPANKLDPSCGGGYTQKDVIEVAKCFTGWTIDKPGGGGTAEMVFDENRHEGGSKTVLGQVIPEGGEKEGLQVLHMLAISPATATFVSSKMAMRFVSDTPPPSLVAKMAATFVKTDGDIKAVLTTMFHAPEFWAPGVYRAKVKTPVEFVASAVRASGVAVKDPAALVKEANELGMPIYGKETPNGYSWRSSEWVSSNALVSRMNFALVMSVGKLPGTATRWHSLLGYSDDSPLIAAPTAQSELALETLLLGQPAAPQTREGVLSEFNDPEVQKAAEKKFAQKAAPGDGVMMAAAATSTHTPGQTGGLNTMAGLILGSPDFQRR